MYRLIAFKNMKKIAILAVAAMMMVACGSGGGGGGEFATVGQTFEKLQNKHNYTMAPLGRITCDYTMAYFLSKDGKIGCLWREVICVPAIFDEISIISCAQSLFLVIKDGKRGVVKAFEKGYIVPCEYDAIISPNPNVLHLQKAGEALVIYDLETGKRETVEGIWPPSQFPTEIPFNVTTDLEYWKIEKITCTGRGRNNLTWVFKVEGTGIKDFESLKQVIVNGFTQSKFRENAFTFFPVSDGSSRSDYGAEAVRFEPSKKDSPFGFTFEILDRKIPLRFTGFEIDLPSSFINYGF